MESPFLYKLPTGSTIFRAKTINKEGRWYALKLEDAYTYGENITEYKTVKDLNLINITSLTFHNDFIDRLNVLFPGEEHSGYDIDKIKCLIPFGLIDLQSQQTSMSLLNSHLNLHESGWNPIFEYLSHNINNRHRFSDHYLDTNLICVLEKIYGRVFDGYISPIKWPTKCHGGLFPRELCFFNLGNVIEQREHKRPHSGGMYDNDSNKNKTPDMSKINYDAIKEQYANVIKSWPSYIGWNSHTDDTDVSSCKMLGGHRRKTRKNRMK
jgi:hypothetical protein